MTDDIDPDSPEALATSLAPHYLRSRRRAHRKWARNHRLLTGIGLITIFGWVWAPFTAWKWRAHKAEAKRYDLALGMATEGAAP